MFTVNLFTVSNLTVDGFTRGIFTVSPLTISQLTVVVPEQRGGEGNRVNHPSPHHSDSINTICA